MLVQAYRSGAAPAWMTAHLLGCLRAETGYDTVREILLAAPGLLAESYAGVAMTRIRGVRARDELIRIMVSAPRLRSREGAACGIGEQRELALVPAVYDAFRSERIRKTTAAACIRTLGVSTATVTEWLRSSDERDRALGVETAIMDVTMTDPTFAEAMKAALRTVSLSPEGRKRILETLERAASSRSIGA